MLRAVDSLSVQSMAHPDGWGIGYYEGDHAVVRKSPERARGSPGFDSVVAQARSALFVAHVRSQTAGSIDLANTHPFAWGGWILAQNGGLGGAWHKRIKTEVGGERINGKTSGEHLLHWLYGRAGHLDGVSRTPVLVQALQELVGIPAGVTSANFVLGTGDCLYAFCFAPNRSTARSLFYLQRQPVRAQVVLVASERLTGATEAWQEVPDGCLLVVNRDLNVHLETVSAI